MFDGAETDRHEYPGLPGAVGHNAITRGMPLSLSATPRPTSLSRGRAVSSDLRKEMTNATFKDVDELRLSIRRLENKITSLESRVQYVNPWAVQHMWDVVLKIQQRLGLPREEADAVAVLKTRATNFGSSKGNTSPLGDPFRSCSPPTPSRSPHFPVSPTLDQEEGLESFPHPPSFKPSSSMTRSLHLEEWMNRQSILIEEYMEFSALMTQSMQQQLSMSTNSAGRSQGGSDVWVAAAEGPKRQLLRSSETSSRYVNPFQAEENEYSLATQRSAQKHASSVNAQPPRLRTQFVESLITDEAFTDRIRHLLAEFVHPIVDAAQKRFASDAERWMDTHVNNLRHEQHEYLEEITKQRDSILEKIEANAAVTRDEVEKLLSSSRKTAQADLQAVSKLREEVLESSKAFALRMQKMDRWHEDVLSSVQHATEERLRSLQHVLERIGDQQDLIHRRLDDVQSQNVISSVLGSTDHRRDSDISSASAGRCIQDAMVYLDGLKLAPLVSAKGDEGMDDHQGPCPTRIRTSYSSSSSRLDESVLLFELHSTLAQLWASCTGGSVKDSSKQHPSSDIHHHHAPIALSLEELLMRPTTLFPTGVVTDHVIPLLLRHTQSSLHSECCRMRLPERTTKGLEAGWAWLKDIGFGLALRHLLRAIGSDPDRQTESNAYDKEEPELNARLLLESVRMRYPPLADDSGVAHHRGGGGGGVGSLAVQDEYRIARDRSSSSSVSSCGAVASTTRHREPGQSSYVRSSSTAFGKDEERHQEPLVNKTNVSTTFYTSTNKGKSTAVPPTATTGHTSKIVTCAAAISNPPSIERDYSSMYVGHASTFMPTAATAKHPASRSGTPDVKRKLAFR